MILKLRSTFKRVKSVAPSSRTSIEVSAQCYQANLPIKEAINPAKEGCCRFSIRWRRTTKPLPPQEWRSFRKNSKAAHIYTLNNLRNSISSILQIPLPYKPINLWWTGLLWEAVTARYWICEGDPKRRGACHLRSRAARKIMVILKRKHSNNNSIIRGLASKRRGSPSPLTKTWRSYTRWKAIKCTIITIKLSQMLVHA